MSWLTHEGDGLARKRECCCKGRNSEDSNEGHAIFTAEFEIDVNGVRISLKISRDDMKRCKLFFGTKAPLLSDIFGETTGLSEGCRMGSGDSLGGPLGDYKVQREESRSAQFLGS